MVQRDRKKHRPNGSANNARGRAEKQYAPLPAREEKHYAPLPPREEKHYAPLPAREEKHYAPLPPREEKHYAPLPVREEKHYAPLPPREEKHYAPLPPREEKHYAPLPPREEKQYTPLPPREEKQYTPLPPREEKQYTPLPPREEKHYAPLPPREEKQYTPLPPREEKQYTPLPANSFRGVAQPEVDAFSEDSSAWRYAEVDKPIDEPNALVPIDLNPFYAALADMRERIREAEESLSHSRLAQETLRQEMDSAAQMAKDAEEELARAAQKAAFLKHEAEQINTEGQSLRSQLNLEEQRWQQVLDEEQQLLAETEQKLRIAEEESQRIYHAKEVAARMNERELWRLGSSKQGLWLQRRKVQGNSLSMTRDKEGNWHVPKVVTSPGVTYAQNVLKREQKNKHNTTDNTAAQRVKHLDMLAESAQALAGRKSGNMESELLTQLAEHEAQRHLAAQTELLATHAVTQKETATQPLYEAPFAVSAHQSHNEIEILPYQQAPVLANAGSVNLELVQALHCQEDAAVPAYLKEEDQHRTIPEYNLIPKNNQTKDKEESPPPTTAQPYTLLNVYTPNLNTDTVEKIPSQAEPKPQPQIQPEPKPSLMSPPAYRAAAFTETKGNIPAHTETPYTLLHVYTPEHNINMEQGVLTQPAVPQTPPPINSPQNQSPAPAYKQPTQAIPPLNPLQSQSPAPAYKQPTQDIPPLNPLQSQSPASVYKQPNQTILPPNTLQNQSPATAYKQPNQTIPPLNTLQNQSPATAYKQPNQAIPLPNTPQNQSPANSYKTPTPINKQPILTTPPINKPPDFTAAHLNKPPNYASATVNKPQDPTPSPVQAPEEKTNTKMAIPPPQPMPSYATPADNELLQAMRPKKTPGQAAPSTDDPLHFLAMQAAMETSAAGSADNMDFDDNFYADSQEQLAAVSERLQAEQLQAKQASAQKNNDGMQQLSRQANMLAQQYLARSETTEDTTGGAAIRRKVIEETGGQDHLLKEKQIAERAIAAAMAAARKAAQSAMALSGQNRQSGNSAEQIIATALSKASEPG
ncbi:MAG: hypothetical protein FWG43_02060 [Clostridiales bacterium]|nr:hypothetical protein [Clostridiales bacterium]